MNTNDYENNVTAVNLIGIDSQIGGNPDISIAFENVDTSAYTIVLTHAPGYCQRIAA